MARPRTCSCGRCRKCLDRIRKKRQYDAMTPAERRAWKAKKNRLKSYVTDRRARRRHIARNPDKAEARKALANALRSGRIVRGRCHVCGIAHGTVRGDGSAVAVQGHHDDYTRPLEVRWLCTTHHRPPWTTDRG